MSGVLVVSNSANGEPDITLFYGKEPIFSNFKITPFKIDGRVYNCTEQFFQARKAEFFGDYATAALIMKTSSPANQKRLGRRVKGYNESRWARVRTAVMEECCTVKFSRSATAKQQLLATGDSVLAEASPFDRRWGIGLAIWNTKAQDSKNWLGDNLMGVVLMNVREKLKNA